MYKLGIDVGGTNTDAVLIDETLHVVASIKQHTTANIYDGILSAVRAVLQQSGVAVTIGGVRTNFRMPDVVSIALGGGSIVRRQPDGAVTVGPDSVGYQITEKALCSAATSARRRISPCVWA